MRIVSTAVWVSLLILVLLPVSANATVKYGPSSEYGRGAIGTPCFHSRHAIEYGSSGGQVLVYRSQFWVWVGGTGDQLNYKFSLGEYDGDTWSRTYSGPWDYPLPLTSSNTPTWIYEYYAWATPNPPRTYGGAWSWMSGGYVRWRDKAGDLFDDIHHAGWDTTLNTSWQWSHNYLKHAFC